MKLISKKKYSYPDLMVMEVDAKDVLSISDAYDNDVFEPTSWGGQSV